MADCNTKHASSSTILFTFFWVFLQFLSLFVAGDSPPPYKPVDNIVLDCGSSGNSSGGDSRPWVGDIDSKFFPLDTHRNNASVTAQVEGQLVTAVPYSTVRLSRAEFTYTFPVSPGQKFVRLYFYSAPYLDFDRSKAVFSVTAALFTLLRDFNASVNADASGFDEMFREYCVNVDENENRLNLTFTPANPDSYAFINGIEIVSMPTNLYYTDPNDQDGPGLRLVGQTNFFPIENSTSLEMVYRENIGGNFISAANDTGMFRTWYQDTHLLDNYLIVSQPAKLDIQLNYSKIHPYTAPRILYQTAQTMGPNRTFNKNFNLTWEYPVDPGFNYMIRLHFCEIEDQVNNPKERVFRIYIRDMIAEQGADVILWAQGKGIPICRDYAVYVPPSSEKVNLSVKLQATPDYQSIFSNAILNGIEIFKLNNTNGSLAGPNPDPPPYTPTESLPTSSISKNSIRKMVTIVVPIVVGGAIAMLALSLFVSRRRRTFTNKTSSEGTAWSAPPHSISTNKSSKTRSSNLPSDLCRYFSLPEIRAATKNFDDVFIIGVGGFGNVYKGYIDDGATQVAIKRLKPGSKQGEHEFKTEIEMLSQLRHLHLVSLIGYCNDGNEMILVYDYMAHGTLRSHLYGGSNNEQPLTWQQRLQICIGAARGLHYLHTGAKHVIIHRDVKTTNILLDEKWVAKVSDFGLSKMGPTSTSKAHVSTVVKGSFGYLDPEYYRRQQLTEKSDVYSFGVVLCEVLCARPPLMKKQVYLAEWVRRSHRDGTVAQIVDPKIRSEISPECLNRFVEIAVSCVQDDGSKRPAMNDVVWGLEFAAQLQEAAKKKGGDGGGGGGEEQWLIGEMFSSAGEEWRGSSALGVSSDVTTSYSSLAYSKGSVFSEIKEPTAR